MMKFVEPGRHVQGGGAQRSIARDDAGATVRDFSLRDLRPPDGRVVGAWDGLGERVVGLGVWVSARVAGSQHGIMGVYGCWAIQLHATEECRGLRRAWDLCKAEPPGEHTQPQEVPWGASPKWGKCGRWSEHAGQKGRMVRFEALDFEYYFVRFCIVFVLKVMGFTGRKTTACGANGWAALGRTLTWLSRFVLEMMILY